MGRFAQVAVPVADEDTPGSFLGPWRLMSMDGFEWDLPATPGEYRRVRVRGYRPRDAAPTAFPKARVVTIGECASPAAIGPVGTPRQRGAVAGPPMYPHLEEDWLLIADRNFYNWQDWCGAADAGAALLWRVRAGLRPSALELLPGRSYRSVLVSPEISGKQ